MKKKKARRQCIQMFRLGGAERRQKKTTNIQTMGAKNGAYEKVEGGGRRV
jgi:hypothetical protein